jgi:hypothetical protein
MGALQLFLPVALAGDTMPALSVHCPGAYALTTNVVKAGRVHVGSLRHTIRILLAGCSIGRFRNNNLETYERDAADDSLVVTRLARKAWVP